MNLVFGLGVACMTELVAIICAPSLPASVEKFPFLLMINIVILEGSVLDTFVCGYTGTFC